MRQRWTVTAPTWSGPSRLTCSERSARARAGRAQWPEVHPERKRGGLVATKASFWRAGVEVGPEAPGDERSPASDEAGLLHNDRDTSEWSAIRSGPPDRLVPGAYLAANGLRAVIELSVPMQTAPLAEPGSLRPSPVSAVTVARNFSAVGSVAAPLT